MSRCFAARRNFIALFALAPVAVVAQTPARREMRGKLTVIQWPLVEIDNRRLLAAPGARIINTNKLTVTPSRVAPGTSVAYELDGHGKIGVIRIVAAPVN